MKHNKKMNLCGPHERFNGGPGLPFRVQINPSPEIKSFVTAQHGSKASKYNQLL